MKLIDDQMRDMLSGTMWVFIFIAGFAVYVNREVISHIYHSYVFDCEETQ